jgi:hypothetical protein
MPLNRRVSITNWWIFVLPRWIGINYGKFANTAAFNYPLLALFDNAVRLNDSSPIGGFHIAMADRHRARQFANTGRIQF